MRPRTDLARTLDSVEVFVRRFVVLTTEHAAAIALWVFHTHAIAAADATAYLFVSSAAKRSGKTRLLEVLELLVRQPLPTANISDAALFRAIAELEPTLLFDEVDAIFGAKARDREDLRGMLCAGYRRGAVARRMGGPKMTTLEAFPVFAAKVFAGIGDLPDTIADRTIRIRLQRRLREEQIERFRRRDADADAEPIFQAAVSLATFHAETLACARPELPNELDDRAQDVWEPLLAIADLAGSEWPDRARQAAVVLSTGVEREDDSMTATLLRDIHAVFTANGAERFKTADLIAELCMIEESPWGDWNNGKVISAQAVSKLLRPYRIKTMPVWAEGKTVRGYKVEQFSDAFARVLGVRGVRAVRSESSTDAAPNTPNPPNAKGTMGEQTAVPLPGDEGFGHFLLRAVQTGHITQTEAAERYDLHKLIEAARR
jgi:hypothetical protein